MSMDQCPCRTRVYFSFEASSTLPAVISPSPAPPQADAAASAWGGEIRRVGCFAAARYARRRKTPHEKKGPDPRVGPQADPGVGAPGVGALPVAQKSLPPP